jgi:hypothetical protein
MSAKTPCLFLKAIHYLYPIDNLEEEGSHLRQHDSMVHSVFKGFEASETRNQ